MMWIISDAESATGSSSVPVSIPSSTNNDENDSYGNEFGDVLLNDGGSELALFTCLHCDLPISRKLKCCT